MLHLTKLRFLIEISELEASRAGMLTLTRRAARNRVFKYAQKNGIIDFQDTVLVEQPHRNFRQNAIDFALARVSEVQAATTNTQLLNVFDQIAPWL